ncbi:MAG: hypothetical protein JWQ57_2771 [Mucilaginibacter sp.]|nr:hypothetical protein [Mucilaginibacter sp.]
MLNKLLTILSVALLFSACKKDGGKARIIVNVKSSSSKSNVYISILSDQTRIYPGKDTLSAISDVSGQLSFSVIPGKIYYLYHYTADDRVIDPAIGSFIKVGTFTSQQEINNWPGQTPPATVGGDHYQDINVDGIINKEDRVLTVTAPASGKTLSVDFPLIAR